MTHISPANPQHSSTGPVNPADDVGEPGWLRSARGANLLDADGRPGVTIFEVLTNLAVQHNAVNLGQGAPDTDGPQEMLQVAMDAIATGPNQYAPGRGLPVLRQAVADHQKRFYDLDVDPAEGVLATTGASEAISAAIIALCRPGDEVITFEPFFDSYGASIGMASARHRTVPLYYQGDSGQWAPDPAELAASFNDRTRVFLLNTPHNPTGAVLSTEILAQVVALARQHDCLIVSDEVYEHLTFDEPHVPVATLPGAYERTLTISSAAKTFSVTGWKVGWISGPTELIAQVRSVKQFLTFSSGGPFQKAVSGALKYSDEYFASLATSLRDRAHLLTAGLQEAGFTMRPGKSGYFTLLDTAPLGFDDAATLAQKLPASHGVAGIPVSAFCQSGHEGPYRSLLRLAFCKTPQSLREAVTRLAPLAPTGTGHSPQDQPARDAD